MCVCGGGGGTGPPIILLCVCVGGLHYFKDEIVNISTGWGHHSSKLRHCVHPLLAWRWVGVVGGGSSLLRTAK